MQARTASAGMTLLELMVGITMFGILVGVAVPNLRSYRESQRISSASQQLAAVCRAAQAKARSENHDVVVEINTVDGMVSVIDDENGSGDADGGEVVIDHPVPTGLRVAATTFTGDRLVFDSHGRMVSGGTIVLSATSDDVEPCRVEFASGTGHVKIRGGPLE